MLKVKAIRTCFVNNTLRHAGDVFDVDDATAASNRHLKVLVGAALKRVLEKEAAARGEELDDDDELEVQPARGRTAEVVDDEDEPIPQPRRKAKKSKKAKAKPRPRARAVRA
ncbi:MAG: hypothetical protein KDE27_02425 [Planctomycetes bacterium]|nr:hypothetical protein [Planctomycetota bacterium]